MAKVVHKTRLLSDNGPSYIAGDLMSTLSVAILLKREKIKRKTIETRRL